MLFSTIRGSRAIRVLTAMRGKRKNISWDSNCCVFSRACSRAVAGSGSGKGDLSKGSPSTYFLRDAQESIALGCRMPTRRTQDSLDSFVADAEVTVESSPGAGLPGPPCRIGTDGPACGSEITGRTEEQLDFVSSGVRQRPSVESPVPDRHAAPSRWRN